MAIHYERANETPRYASGIAQFSTPADRYAVIDLPPLSAHARQAFSSLPQDPYCGGGQRFRRFSQYKLFWNQTRWELEKLPHRPFIQSREYNSYVGGIPRHLEPLMIDPTPQIAAGADAIPLDRDDLYQINVHQCRVIADQSTHGISVPEGPHRDGHEWGMVAVFERNNINGGETWLLPNEGGRPFFTVTLQPNQAILYQDDAMKHYATEIVPQTPEGGYRDLWIVAYNRWANRRYGEDFEARAKRDPQ